MDTDVKTEHPVRFLCCTHLFKPGEKPVFDEEGYIVCPEHGQRRYGWRSLPMIQMRSHPFDLNDPRYITKPDYSLGLDTLLADRLFVNVLLLHLGSLGVPIHTADPADWDLANQLEPELEPSA